MGLAGLIARRAGLVIAVWVLAAALAAPLAARLDEVLVAEEAGLLPPTAESIRALEALEVAGARAEPDAILLVSGVPVDLGTFWSLADEWESIDWRGAGRLSWVDVALEAYSTALEGYSEAVNASLEALRGAVELWEGVREAAERLEGLAALANATASAMAAAGEAYAGYYSALAQLAAAAPGLREALEGGALLCSSVPPAYASVLFDVARAEFYLENLTDAYQAGALDEGDVAVVVAASNLSWAGIPPLDPRLVGAVYAYTASIGGPGAFNNTHAAILAGEVLASQAPEAAGYARALAGAVAAALRDAPDLRGLAAAGLEGLRQLNATAYTAAHQARAAALEAYGSLLAAEAGSPLIEAAYRALAAMGCSPEAVPGALVEAMEAFLASQGIPEPAASELAAAAAAGNTSKRLAARLALETVASQAEARGAPAELVEALRSPAAVEAILELDPDATGALAADPRLAARAAALTLEPLAGGTLGPGLLEALALGEADPEEAALGLAAAGAPPEAAPLLEAMRASGVPETLEDAIELAVEVVAGQAAGAPPGEALEAARAAARVLLGESTVEEEARRLAARALEAAWPGLLEEITGSLVSRDGDNFLVLLFNVTYDDAAVLKAEVAGALAEAGYGARVLATGGVVAEREIREAALEDVERSDLYSMVFVVVVLALVLQGIVAIFLPFTGIGLGLAAALALAYLLASRDAITVTTISRAIMFSTGLGLGIDYAALVSRRFREELAAAAGPREAAERALKASARPVIAGAATAAIGFGSLALAWDFPFLKSIGSTVPIAIAMVALASLTFTPALLAIAGGSRLLWWPSRPGQAGPGAVGERLGSAVARAAPALLLLSIAWLPLAVLVHAGFQGSHDLTIMMPEGTESLEALRVVSEEFDPGVVYPIYVVTTGPEAAGRVAGALESLACIARARVEDAAGASIVVAVPSVNPLTAEGVDCARQAREAAHAADPGSLVGGMAAASLDLEVMLNERFYGRVLPAAVALMFLSMLAAYGGVAVALAAVASVAIAAEYAIAATVYYFQEVAGSQVPWFLPITVFTAILGVGMDYNSFSIARAAEECLRDCSRRAVARAVSRSSLLVLGLALIMASAYGGLTLSSIPNLRMMGTALALGVLAAGALAGLTLTPALIAALGRRAWWPWGPRAEGGK